MAWARVRIPGPDPVGRSAFPSFLDAVALSIILMVGVIGVPFLLPPSAQSVWIEDVVRAVVFAGVLWLGWRISGRPLAVVFPIRPVSGSLMLAVVVTTVGVIVTGMELNRLVQRLWPMPEWLVSQLEAALERGPRGLVILRLAVLVPLAEELFVRGLILDGFRRRHATWRAIAGSALIFAALHLNPWQAVPAFLAGLLLGWWVARSGSLIPALVSHALVNGTFAVFALTLSRTDPASGEGALLWSRYPGLQPVLGVVFLVGGIWMSRRVFARFRQREILTG